MKRTRVQFIYPRFERHAQSHPELLDCVPADEYLGGAGLGIASIAAVTPADVDVAFHDDRITPFTLEGEAERADVYALSFFTPAATRALALADELRAAGRTVVAGGIFPTMMPDVAAAHFDAIVVGEGEGVWPELLADVAAGRLKPRYQSMAPFDLARLPPPRLDLYVDAESKTLHPDDYPLQLSRGCPLTCDACAIPGTLGRALRVVPRATAKAALADMRRFGKRAALTEDTSFFFFSGARRHFREFLADLAEDPRPAHDKVSYVGISMPMILAVDPALLRELVTSGVDRFYLVGGFDPITRGAFGKGEPRALEKALAAIARCHEHGIEPYVSFLVGNETDDEGVFDRMLEFTARARIEKCEFAVFTPYPGTPAWRALEAEGRITSRTWKHYNDANVVFRPKQMSAERLQRGYLDLWREFYRSKQHLREAPHHARTVQF
jgi:radical SAM superfamily enzyme YgiQ (UPF0313 family)